MSAPANDAWASAQVLSTGGSGSVSGTNIDATSEAGEPAFGTHGGKTVWYSWTPAVDELVVFGTIYKSYIGLASPPLLTTMLQIFTGSSVSGLTEVPYYHGSFNQRFGNWEIGSQVVFLASHATTYYIRIDTGSEPSGATGNFKLWWQGYFPLNVGGCVTCPPASGCGMTCLGSVQPDVSPSGNTGVYYGSDAGSPTLFATPQKGNSYTFAGLPKGTYYVKYCGGSFQTSVITVPTPYTVNFNWGAGFPNLSEGWVVRYNDATNSGTTTDKWIFDSSVYSQTPGGAIPLVVEQDMWTRLFTNDFGGLFCCGKQLLHSGGDISIFLIDPDWRPNAGGPLSPVFGLYRNDEVPNVTQIGSSACASWTTVGVHATCTFQVFSTTSGANVSATLDSSGGISGSSTATGITMAGGTVTAITLTFDCTTENVTAKLLLSSPNGNCGDSALTFFLGPVLTMTQGGIISHSSSCNGFVPPIPPFITMPCNVAEFGLSPIANAGFWGLATASILQSFDPGVALFLGCSGGGNIGPCSTTPTQTTSGASLPCASSSSFPVFTVAYSTPGTYNVYYAITTDAGTVVNFSFPLVLP